MEKPYETLYVINFIDLNILTQNNMHTSNDVFSRFHMIYDKNYKVRLNDCNVKDGALQ